MPLLMDVRSDERFELGDLVEALETGPADLADDDCLASYAPALRRLANNRAFLGDLVIEELKQRCAGQIEGNRYSAQVILLHRGSRKFLLRANFWPAAEDSVVVNSGAGAFFYGQPHDHNFSFLTVGYAGPGYWSDYYEYDYERVAGFIGEKVGLRFVERSRLAEGTMLLYRRHLDVHSQLPADSLSVSINVLAMSPATEFLDQYGFDLQRSRINAVVNRSTLEPLIALAGHIGGEDGRDLIEHIAERHPSERIRFAAWRAKANAADGPDERAAIFDEAAATSPSTGFVRGMAEREAARIRNARAFYKGGAIRPTAP
ncbi:MAG TPA: transposase [Allosphingosinicella sp.]|nr:transposase [Allosphingosinicella sp.]